MRYTAFHLDSERGLRGGERQLLYLAAWLRAQGHGSVVVCRAGAPLEGEARRLGLDVRTLPFCGELDPVTAWRLAREAGRAENPVLHAHTAHAAGTAALAARLGGPPWVAHRRVDFRLANPVSARLKYGAASRVVAVSEFIKGVLAKDGVDPSRVDVVPDALPLGPAEAKLAGLDVPWGPAPDRDALRRRLGAQTELDPGALWVGNLAAMVGHKDQANLLRAMPAVLASEPRARFLVVGDGPLRADLEALARELGVAQAVRFPGRQDDPRPWLQSLDVYCQPSWGEGMGSVLLEAMACRVPVVATTAGGIPEVTKGTPARLVPPRDPAALAAALLAALREPGGASAPDLTRFSLEATGNAVLAAYAKARA
ncbi:glycosyltransferase [bacterium]|nr:MAG: glycosyltransferase [bacterium]